MALKNHAFCWNGIASTDTVEMGPFYEAVLGWKLAEHTFPNGEKTSLFSAQDWPRAHLRDCLDGETDHWISFLRVIDVDKSTDSAVANGGTVDIQPNDIAPGRFSVVTAPSGAPLALYHEANEDEAEAGPIGPGAVHWTELHSGDIEKDVAWLKSTFGYTIQEMPMPQGGTYYICLAEDGAVCGGACPCMIDGGKPQWLTWIHVEDVDATAQKITELGGKAPTEGADYPGVGRMALVADPTGAAFGIITPAAAPGN